jgi:hypothetical protein
MSSARAADHGGLITVDLRQRETLHLHVVAHGDYDIGVFAYDSSGGASGTD